MELALSHAHADWLKNDEEMRQREIDQAVEVAITNAVAEAKVEWEKEIMAQVSTFKDPYVDQGTPIRLGHTQKGWFWEMVEVVFEKFLFVQPEKKYENL